MNINSIPSDRVNLDLQETSEILNLTVSQVRTLVKNNKLESLKCGRQTWVTVKSVKSHYYQWLEVSLISRLTTCRLDEYDKVKEELTRIQQERKNI